MVEGPVQRTNHFRKRAETSEYISDYIDFRPRLDQLNHAEVRELFIEKRLSASQIAARLDCSKTHILRSIHDFGLSRPKVDRADPENYTLPIAPYGYRKSQNKLVVDAKELRIAKLIVELKDRRGMNILQVGRELVRLKLSARSGKVAWHNHTVTRIYKYWKNKI